MKPRSWRRKLAPDAVLAHFARAAKRVARRVDCPTGKARYDSRAWAKGKLAEIRHHRRASGQTRCETRVYRCKACNGYHLTSKPRPARRQRREVHHAQP